MRASIKDFYIEVQEIADLDFSKLPREFDEGSFLNEHYCNGYSAEYTAEELLKELKKFNVSPTRI